MTEKDKKRRNKRNNRKNNTTKRNEINMENEIQDLKQGWYIIKVGNENEADFFSNDYPMHCFKIDDEEAEDCCFEDRISNGTQILPANSNKFKKLLDDQDKWNELLDEIIAEEKEDTSEFAEIYNKMGDEICKDVGIKKSTIPFAAKMRMTAFVRWAEEKYEIEELRYFYDGSGTQPSKR